MTSESYGGKHFGTWYVTDISTNDRRKKTSDGNRTTSGRVIASIHDELGHHGRQSTYDQVARRYRRDGMYGEVCCLRQIMRGVSAKGSGTIRGAVASDLECDGVGKVGGCVLCRRV